MSPEKYVPWALLFLCFVASVKSYNLSPKANFIIKDPNLNTPMKKTQASLFGYTIVMRQKGIFVGAPRAQSSLESQRNINEPGVIYRCSLQQPSNCVPYVLESRGNLDVEYSEITYDSEKRDFQMLGAAMDGGTQDTDKLIVCAPKFIAPTFQDYLMHGICYWVNDTLTEKPDKINKLMPLRLKTEQIKKENGVKYYYYMLAEQGFSAHVSPNNEEFLIGAPGLHTWKGSFIRYRQVTLESDPMLSRRDLNSKRVARQSNMASTKVYSYDITNPAKWDQPNDSYFGYSVSSGYFDSENRKKLLYIASAPQAFKQDGEAYLFDINGTTITKYFVFRGSKFGEYFGYSILAEDLNNDGLTDVIISAPQYSINEFNEDGAIYVFINQGRFNFERKIIVSPLHVSGRFGTTLSALGDINKDGFKDIAVGTPYAGNGTVFVFLGDMKGLRDRPSQRLDSPTTLKSSYPITNIFGHGLSKGSDYDDNGFNDLAVGAPNAEAVMVYRAYPVVKIVATVHSKTRELKPEQGTFPITACYSIQTTSPKIHTQEVQFRIAADPAVKRVRFLNGTTSSNEVKFNDVATLEPKCRTLAAEVRFSFADIFKPIELEIHYNLAKTVPDSEVFCETCAAVDPDDAKVFVEKIIFNTGCASEICVANMQVDSVNPKISFILGSSNTLKMTYEIKNMGETAYLPQINFTSSNHMPFAKIPSNCKVDNKFVMLCDLNNGRPMMKDGSLKMDVLYDTSDISGKKLVLTAQVFSTGLEKTPVDNVLQDVIILQEFTEIAVFGTPTRPLINLEEVSNTTEIVNNYEIKSYGPSTVSALEIVFTIPVAYRQTGSKKSIPIIDEQRISMQAVYDAQLLNVDFYENNTQILMNAIEYTSSASRYIQQDYNIDAASMGPFNIKEINAMAALESRSFNIKSALTDDEDMSQLPTPRRRRDVVVASLASSAAYEQAARYAHTDVHTLLTEDMRGSLPANRTIVFNCRHPESTVCVRAVMKVYNFKPGKTITVNLKYHIDLNEVNQILMEPWEVFVVLIDLDLKRMGTGSADENSTLLVNKKMEYNIISKHQLYSTPILLIILAVLGGLLFLAVITYGMYKLGFFKRVTKEEMEQLVHQAKVAGDEAPETANLNSENH